MTLQKLKNPQRSLGQVLHIGAGAGGDLQTYLEWDARRITLVEPDSENLLLLQDAGKGNDRIQIIAAAVTTRKGPCKLFRFEFSDLNSLRRPTGLWALFPGLEELSQDTVTVCDPVALVDQLRLDDRETHMLVVEAPGEVLDILAELDQADRLMRFSIVCVQEGRSSLYEQAGTFEDIQALLEAAGFHGDIQTDDSDPERPILMVRFDQVGALQEELKQQHLRWTEAETGAAQFEAECAALQERLMQTAEELRTAQSDLAARDAALTTAQSDLAARDAALTTAQSDLAARDAALTTAQSDLAARDAALTTAQSDLAARDAALQTAQSDLAARDAALKTAQSDLAAKIKLAEQHAAREEDLGNQVALLQAERSKLEAHLSDLKRQHEQDVEALRAEKTASEDLGARRKDEIETLRQKATQAEERSAQMSSDLRVALRTQALAQADLSDLQTRFAQLSTEKESQDALLLKVTQRLTAASAYLHELPQPPEAGRRSVTQKAPRKSKSEKTSAAVRAVKRSAK